MTRSSFEAGRAALTRVRDLFPSLSMAIREDAPNLDLSLDIATQPGLDFDMNLNLQNIDELHLDACGVWMCWFPCTEDHNIEDFIETVSDLIRGESRILQTVKGGKTVKANIQYFIDGNWVSKSNGLMTFKLPSFGRKTFKIVRNGKNS